MPVAEEITDKSNRWDSLIDLPTQQLAQIAALGAVVGLVVYGLTQFIYRVIMLPLFCGDPNSVQCASTVGIADGIATVLGGIVGLMGLVRFSVFRPLLIVLAAVIALWGLGGWVADLFWFEALLWSVLLYGVTYIALSWFVRPRAFAPAIITVLVLVVLARWFSVL